MPDELRPLGRVVEHDERSRAFAVQPAAAPLKTVVHQRHVPIFDQGNLGSCTGNAAAGCMATGPWKQRTTEAIAISLYKRATVLDGFPGTYPPTDTGSSGLAVMKAVAERRWIRAYHHAFSMNDALAALQTSPAIIGIDWLEGYDKPGPGGLLTPAGGVRGGHELCIDMIDVDRRLVGGANSWGPLWGDKGRWTMTWDTFAAALAAQGDCTVPIP